MNIYTAPGEFVRLNEHVIGSTLEHQMADARKILDLGVEYEVDHVERSSSYSYVYIKDCVAFFNTMLFENVSENPKTVVVKVNPHTFLEEPC